MGTLSLPRFQRKVRAFELARAGGLFEKHWGLEDFEVYVLAETEARRESLANATRAVVPEDRWASYFFATFEALDPERLNDGESWRGLDGSTYRLLYGFDDQYDDGGEDSGEATTDVAPSGHDEDGIDRGLASEAD